MRYHNQQMVSVSDKRQCRAGPAGIDTSYLSNRPLPQQAGNQQPGCGAIRGRRAVWDARWTGRAGGDEGGSGVNSGRHCVTFHRPAQPVISTTQEAGPAVGQRMFTAGEPLFLHAAATWAGSLRRVTAEVGAGRGWETVVSRGGKQRDSPQQRPKWRRRRCWGPAQRQTTCQAPETRAGRAKSGRQTKYSPRNREARDDPASGRRHRPP